MPLAPQLYRRTRHSEPKCSEWKFHMWQVKCFFNKERCVHLATYKHVKSLRRAQKLTQCHMLGTFQQRWKENKDRCVIQILPQVPPFSLSRWAWRKPPQMMLLDEKKPVGGDSHSIWAMIHQGLHFSLHCEISYIEIKYFNLEISTIKVLKFKKAMICIILVVEPFSKHGHSLKWTFELFWAPHCIMGELGSTGHVLLRDSQADSLRAPSSTAAELSWVIDSAIKQRLPWVASFPS